jgi:hypothetical protein
LIVLLVGAALLCGSCRSEPKPKPFDRSAAEAEAALRKIGLSMFDVLNFATGTRDGGYMYIPDDFRFGTSLYLLYFDAEIRYGREVRIRSREETIERLRDPSATPKEIEGDIALARLLGAGQHPSGSTQMLHATAVFEEVESGWRFVAVDRRSSFMPL